MFSQRSLTETLNIISDCFNISFSDATFKLWQKILEPYFDEQQLARLPKLMAIAAPRGNMITPRLAIELLHGAPEYHAEIEWRNDEYSAIGRIAIEMIGGTFIKNNSNHQEQLYQRFLKSYIRLWEDAVVRGAKIPSKQLHDSTVHGANKLISAAKNTAVIDLLKQMQDFVSRDTAKLPPEKPTEKPKKLLKNATNKASNTAIAQTVNKKEIVYEN